MISLLHMNSVLMVPAVLEMIVALYLLESILKQLNQRIIQKTLEEILLVHGNYKLLRDSWCL